MTTPGWARARAPRALRAGVQCRCPATDTCSDGLRRGGSPRAHAVSVMQVGNSHARGAPGGFKFN